MGKKNELAPVGMPKLPKKLHDRLMEKIQDKNADKIIEKMQQRQSHIEAIKRLDAEIKDLTTLTGVDIDDGE